MAPDAPAFLVSYAYLSSFEATREKFTFRDWALDSGAFTAYSSGKPVDLAAYTDTALRYREADPTLADVFALDVIGDWEASARNAEEMTRQGLTVVPCFHYGEPWEALVEMADRYDKIALGGVARKTKKLRRDWFAECFGRVWPKLIHGFGVAQPDLVIAFPFHSVDASSWEFGPVAFGNWRSFRGGKSRRMSVPGSGQNLRSEVEYYLRLEREARSRWRSEMQRLNAKDDIAVRLAVGHRLRCRSSVTAFGKE